LNSQNLEFKTKRIPQRRHKGLKSKKEEKSMGKKLVISPGNNPQKSLEKRIPNIVAIRKKEVKRYHKKRVLNEELLG